MTFAILKQAASDKESPIQRYFEQQYSQYYDGLGSSYSSDSPGYIAYTAQAIAYTARAIAQTAASGYTIARTALRLKLR